MIIAKDLSEKIDQAEWATDELRARLGEFILELDKEEDSAELASLKAEVERLNALVAKQKAEHDAWVINRVYRGIVDDEVITEEDIKNQIVDDVDKDKDEIKDFDVSML